ncbi:MAG TPA: hypothetical protein VLC93_04895 [Myxococcota bacterium]|nr:hypothetical protein [Myxococcota bacterium]
MQFLNAISVGDGLLQRVSDAIGGNSPDKLSPLHLARLRLTDPEKSLLVDYGKRQLNQRAGGWHPLDGAGNQDPIEQTARAALFHILTGPVDVSTEFGKATETTRMLLGIRNVTDTIVHEGLLKKYTANHLADSFVFYNGHATAATLSLFPMLGALGLRDIGFNVSNYSGDKGVRSLFNTMLHERMAVSDGTDAQVRFLQSLDKNPKKPIILINAGKFFDGMVAVSQSIRKRIMNGDIRFVMHNAADQKALAKIAPGAIMIDLANSDAKKLEAQVIGEQCAVHCGQAALDHLKMPLKDTYCIVKGAGLIGGSALKGLIAFGYSPDRIVVIDPDPEMQAHANELRIEHVYDKAPPWLAAEKHGVLLVATNGMGLTAADVDGLPHHTVTLTTTTGGGGIDMRSLQQRLPQLERTNARFMAHGTALTDQNIFEDVILRESSTGRRITVVSCRYDDQQIWRAYPPNLLDTAGQMRLVTSAMLNVAVCEAAAETRPGLHKLSQAGEDLIDKAFGMSTPGPLIAGLIPPRLRLAVEGLDCRPRQQLIIG